MNSIVVLLNGASASGKSRLLAGAQRIAEDSGVLRGGVRIAERTTTRAPRRAESLPTENLHVDAARFEEAVRSGALDVSWRRTVAGTQEIRYGFALAPELARGGAVLLSGNNYLDWTEQPLLSALRGQGRLTVVRVWASHDTRLARLAERRPALSPAELECRMADVPAHALPPADHVIPNNPEFQIFAVWELLRLIAAFRFSTEPWHEDPPAHDTKAIGAA